MNRRDLLKLTPVALAGPALAASLARQLVMLPGSEPPEQPHAQNTSADITLRIAPVTVEIAPDRILSTIGYNGSAPGPVLRMKEGKPVTVTVINDTDTPELVHWHGLTIPGEVDGVEEEDTPAIGPHASRTYQFTPAPSGSRWYHSHAMAMSDLHKGAYTGQFGFVYIEPAASPAAPSPHYDQELFLALRDWEPFFTTQMVDTDENDDPNAPQPERPATLNTAPNGLEVNSTTFSINDRALGAGEPIRVHAGQRVLFHFLNASAIENRRLSLGGHTFQVLALDGNPVPAPAAVETLFLGAGERICALVEMNNPGNWILGEPTDLIRNAGLGVIVEYANQHRQAQWIKPKSLLWDYTAFGNKAPSAPYTPPATNIDMIFEKVPGGAGRFNTFLVNGKPYPHEREFLLHQGRRYRLTLRNRTDDGHPVHLHRHQLELVDVNGKPTSGVIKDTVVVPFYGRAAVEFTASQPGLSLFHCHIQAHMDFGFKALFRSA
ncbi:MAG: multicopper oxidase domain-containing protein [Acidobacteriota bacterium]|nr:multicopper oxidase domain-containing protein [Acidobacteriota bacterium]